MAADIIEQEGRRPRWEEKRNENRKYNGENINETGGATGRLEGRNPILEALKAEHTINRIYIEKRAERSCSGKDIRRCKEKGIVVSYLDKAGMNQMSETRNHQGVIADVSPYSYAEVEDILKKAEDMAQLPLIFIF